MLALGNCNICAKQKISVINKMKQDKISLNQKFWIEKNFIEYCERLLKFWTKFAQLSSIFHGMNNC